MNIKFSNLIKISRPLSWVIAPLLILICLRIRNIPINAFLIVEMILLSFPFCLFLFGINDIYDYKTDIISFRKNRLADGQIIKPEDTEKYRNIFLFFILPLVLTSVLTRNMYNITSILILILFSYFYSAPPIRLKEKPFLDFISNGIIVFLIILIPFSFASIFSLPELVYFIILGVMAAHIIGTIIDYKVDKKAGIITTATFLGKRISAMLPIIFLLIIIVFSSIQSFFVRLFLYYSLVLSALLFIFPREKFARTVLGMIFAGFVVAGITYLLL